MVPSFRVPEGRLPNLLVLSYTLLGYPAGVALLLQPALWANVVGVLLTGHTMVYAAYMLHEFAHGAIFRTPADNQRWGVLMTWITGSCYAPFAALRHKHMRHHVDRADVLTLDYHAVLHGAPRWVFRLVLALEWAWIPAVEFIMHGYVMLLPFLRPERKSERPRLLLILAIRGAAFTALFMARPAALALYALAYLLMLHVLRFGDAYQHTYDGFAVLEGGDIPDDKVRDRAYEQLNTYSNLLSVDRPWLNLLMLNFTYHNAHHEKPMVAWHALPKLHAELFPTEYRQVLPFGALIRGYHRDRLARITSADYGEVGDGPDRAARFLGAVGVSFLTAV